MFNRYSKFYLIANSVGAYLSILSLSDKPIEKTMLISPIIDMESLILEMIRIENISEEELSLRKKSIHYPGNFCLGNIFLMLEIIL